MKEKAEPVVENDTVLIWHLDSPHHKREVICKKGAESFDLGQDVYERTVNHDSEGRDIFIPRPKGTDH